jgi:hypothetical protein
LMHLEPAVVPLFCIAIVSVAVAIDIRAANLSSMYDEGACIHPERSLELWRLPADWRQVVGFKII